MKQTFLTAATALFLASVIVPSAFAQKKPRRAPMKKPAPAAAPAAPAPAPAAEAAPAAQAPEAMPAGQEATAPAAPATGGTYRAAYGMAGCGLGSLIIKSPSKGPQIGSWFINSVVGVQTFAMTSGTSNCKSKGGMAYVDEQETFVSANLPRLEQEAAQGQGELLSSFADVLGCEGTSADTLKRLSQERYDYVFETSDAATVLSRTHELLKSASATCSRV